MNLVLTLKFTLIEDFEVMLSQERFHLPFDLGSFPTFAYKVEG